MLRFYLRLNSDHGLDETVLMILDHGRVLDLTCRQLGELACFLWLSWQACLYP
jgi:hypothetical protein